MPDRKKLTVSAIRKMKAEKCPVVMVTAYDCFTAAFAEKAGLDLILVGDSVGMAQLGYSSTVPVTMDDMIHHCKAVRRGAPNTFIVGDMPFASYSFPEDAVRNGCRFIQEAGCDCVKLEGGREAAPVIARLVETGIPVMAHIGLRPQQVNVLGGYKIQGKTQEAAEQLLLDADAVQAAGAFSVVLECIPAALAEQVTERLQIPTVGIGAGVGCDGQVQVVNDILGLGLDFLPKHAKRYAHIGEEMISAFASYASEVRGRTFPGPENSH